MNWRPSVNASYGTFNNIGNDQHNTNITYIEGGHNDLEITAHHLEHQIYHAMFGVMSFTLLIATVLVLVYMYALPLNLEFENTKPSCRCTLMQQSHLSSAHCHLITSRYASACICSYLPKLGVLATYPFPDMLVKIANPTLIYKDWHRDYSQSLVTLLLMQQSHLPSTHCHLITGRRASQWLGLTEIQQIISGLPHTETLSIQQHVSQAVFFETC